MQKISPCLWFDDNAEEAVRFYTSVFQNARTGTVTRYGDAAAEVARRPKGSVMTVTFQLEGQDFMALNGGPRFQFTPAVSLIVSCETQGELDELWGRLSADGGEEQPCGWVRDKYGVSWQIVPRTMERMMADPDPARSERVMAAILQMKKLDLDAIERAYRGG